MAGLSAGIRLAHYGKRVCILEQHSLVGGLNSYYRRHGHDFEVGLHAMTNFVGPKEKSAPLNKLLRQLRLRYDDLALCQQNYSLVRFPDTELRFSNDFAELEAEVARHFPHEIDGFRGLVHLVRDYNAFSLSGEFLPAREVIEEHVRDPLLQDMILCPLMFYGNAAEDDMDFSQFCIMFRSIFLEGFCRPRGGVRHILDLLLTRYRESDGELRMNCGVEELGLTGDRVTEVRLRNGDVLSARSVLSTAGFVETMKLCDPLPDVARTHPPGQLSFVETIFVLDRPPADFGMDSTIVFESSASKLHYARPTSIVDQRSMVVCVPNNFDLPTAEFSEGFLRITHLADYEPWCRMEADEYQDAKNSVLESELEIAERFIPDVRSHVVCTDMFTPRSIIRFTGHIHGAVYGSPHKSKDGLTPFENLFVCGTDQGFLGIIGSLMSGASIANAYLLR